MAKVDTLKVSFAALDPGVFTYAPNCSLSAGQLVQTVSGTYRGAVSVDSYDLSESHCFVEVVQASTATGGTNSANTSLNLQVDSNNRVTIEKDANTLYFLRTVAGTITTVGSIAYNATTHRWWKISHSGTTVTYWTSEDGVTWTSRATWTPTFAVTVMQVALLTGWWSGSTTGATNAIFDNLNIDGTEVRLELAPYLVGAGGTKHFIGGGVGLRSYVVAPSYAAAWNDAEPWTDSDPWIE